MPKGAHSRAQRKGAGEESERMAGEVVVVERYALGGVCGAITLEGWRGSTLGVVIRKRSSLVCAAATVYYC